MAHAGAIVADNRNVPVTVGTFLADKDDVAELVVGVSDGKAIYLEDVATVSAGPDHPEQYVRFGTGAAAARDWPVTGYRSTGRHARNRQETGHQCGAHGGAGYRHGSAQLRGIFIPDGVEYTVTRNYGKTADDKAKKLIQKLAFATVSVILLIMVVARLA